jgi:hypothetical protein
MTWDMRETGIWWEKVSLNGRIAWMKAAGYTSDISLFAANISWKNLQTSCQVALQRTELPVNYER